MKSSGKGILQNLVNSLCHLISFIQASCFHLPGFIVQCVCRLITLNLTKYFTQLSDRLLNRFYNKFLTRVLRH